MLKYLPHPQSNIDTKPPYLLVGVLSGCTIVLFSMCVIISHVYFLKGCPFGFTVVFFNMPRIIISLLHNPPE